MVEPGVLTLLTEELGLGLAVLDIAGTRSFRYESVYFDTPALDSYRGAAHGRRLRFKVRTRNYLDSGGCVLEVKTRNGRGETVKSRLPYTASDRNVLTAEGLAFVAECAHLPGACGLAPVLTTSYRRTTVVEHALVDKSQIEVPVSAGPRQHNRGVENRQGWAQHGGEVESNGLAERESLGSIEVDVIVRAGPREFDFAAE